MGHAFIHGVARLGCPSEKWHTHLLHLHDTKHAGSRAQAMRSRGGTGRKKACCSHAGEKQHPMRWDHESM
eukprot:1160065-Pelagomonas_calceolata.AAC.6